MRQLSALVPSLPILLLLATTGTARADFAPPSHPSKPLAARSANGRFNAVVSPPSHADEDPETGQTTGSYKPPRTALYSGAKPGGKPIWTAELPEELKFSAALISNDGRHVAVLDEQNGHPAAIVLGPRGETVATLTLDDMLAEHERVRVSRSTQRTFWSTGKSRIEGSKLVLEVGFAGSTPFSRSGSRSIEVELTTGKVLNRSPETTAPAPELVKRLRVASDPGEIESLAVQLRKANDPSTGPALLELARDPAASTSTRLAALEALRAVGTDEQLLALASSLGGEPMVDRAVIRELERRRMKAAIPHLEKLAAGAKERSLRTVAADAIETLRRPPPPKERELGELLKSDDRGELEVAFRRLKPEDAPQHLEQLLRLCANADSMVRRRAEDALLRYLDLRRPNPSALARLTALATSQRALAANAPVVLIAMATLASDQAEELLSIAMQARGVAREQGAATAASRLAALQLSAGRTQDALQTARALEKELSGLSGCAPHDRGFRLASRDEHRCRPVPAAELAKRIRESAAPPVRLEAELTREEGVGLVLTTRIINVTSGVLHDVKTTAGHLSYRSDDGTPCAPMLRPFVRRNLPPSAYGAPRKLSPKERSETVLSLSGWGGPKAKLQLDMHFDVSVKDAKGREWRQTVPVTATTTNP